MIEFNRTGRGLADLQGIYPKALLNVSDLKDKIVLDISTGNGLFPLDLRKDGIVAYGLDIALNQSQKKNLHADAFNASESSIELPASEKTKVFISGDALNTNIKDSQVDVIYDSYGLFYYYKWKDIPNISKVFQECRRILKTNGVINFGIIDDRELLRNMKKDSKFLHFEGFSPPKFHKCPRELFDNVISLKKI